MKYNFDLYTYLYYFFKKKEWTSKNCKTVKRKISEGVYKIRCKCYKLSPTTIVNDINNIYHDSRTDEVFSKEGT